MICINCGSDIGKEELCPSCGQPNVETNPEPSVQEESEAGSFRRMHKAYVKVISIFGIIVSAGYAVFWLYRLSHVYDTPKLVETFALIYEALVIYNIIEIVAFINVLRMRKWAIWVVRIVFVLNLVCLALSSNLFSLEAIWSILVIVLFSVGDWSDFSRRKISQ